MADCLQPPTKFTSFVLGRDKDGNYVIDQNAYSRNLECIPPDASFQQPSVIAHETDLVNKLAPDFLFEISQMAQVTEEICNEQINAVLRRIDRGIKYTV